MSFYANATMLLTTQVTPSDGVVPASVTCKVKPSGGSYTSLTVTLIGQVSTNPPTWAYQAYWTPTVAGTYIRQWASTTLDGRDYATITIEPEP